MPTLYRDYRPQKFRDILGQNHLKITLQNELAQAKIGQAYLFCGPRAVGKTSMARVLAQAVNCEKRKIGESEPCGECRACLAVKKGNFMDVMEIDAASNTGVDNVRDNIISSARLAPSSGKMRVYIIDEVHMLSISAFNALLKIIEEPPQHVLFILCTTEVHKVPATIISRCQRFDFKRISPAEIIKKLSFIASQEKIEIDAGVLADIARQSGGHLRDAESIMGQILSLGDKTISAEEAELVLPHHHNQEAIALIDALAKKNAGAAVTLINQLADNGVNFKNFIAEVLLMLRKIMLQSAQPGLAEKLGLDFGEQVEIQISRLASEFGLDNCLRSLRRFLVLSQERASDSSQLSLEIAVVELCLSKDQSNNQSLDIASTPGSIRTNIITKATNANEAPSSLKKEELRNEKKLESSVPINIAHDLSGVEIVARWPEVLVKIKKHNHSLSFVLQNSQPQDLVKGILSLRFRYKFHRDRILDASIRSLMESSLAEVFGGRVSINAILDESMTSDAKLSSVITESVPEINSVSRPISSPKSKEPNDSVLGSLLATFGGEAV
ncbi:MAG: DNA polymerase III subunit gamma/tau [Patescibacteria group bacterium]|nr:DNA polymerase III subunit gamma/tau [Patescibacteria group bacterium]